MKKAVFTASLLLLAGVTGCASGRVGRTATFDQYMMVGAAGGRTHLIQNANGDKPEDDVLDVESDPLPAKPAPAETPAKPAEQPAQPVEVTPAVPVAETPPAPVAETPAKPAENPPVETVPADKNPNDDPVLDVEGEAKPKPADTEPKPDDPVLDVEGEAKPKPPEGDKIIEYGEPEKAEEPTDLYKFLTDNGTKHKDNSGVQPKFNRTARGIAAGVEWLGRRYKRLLEVINPGF